MMIEHSYFFVILLISSSSHVSQVAKGNISYMACHRDSIQAEIMAHQSSSGSLPLPLPLPVPVKPSRSPGPGRTYTPVRSSVYSESLAATQGQGQGQGQVVKDVWSRPVESTADHTLHAAKFNYGGNALRENTLLRDAIAHVMHSGPVSSSRRGQTQLIGKDKDGSALPTIWTRVCRLHEKQGEDADGHSLPYESLGILRSISSISIDQPPVHPGGPGEHLIPINHVKDSSNVTPIWNSKINLSDTLSPIILPVNVNRYKRNRDSEIKDKHTQRQDHIRSLADTWRAAGFTYGEEAKNVLQAQIHLPGHPSLVSFPCDKVLLVLMRCLLLFHYTASASFMLLSLTLFAPWFFYLLYLFPHTFSHCSNHSFCLPGPSLLFIY